MSKEQIKQTIREAIETDPHKEDILKVSLFGSYAYGNPDSDSDVDLLIEFSPDATVGFFKLARIQRHLRESVGKKVDLLTPQAISKYFRDEVIAKSEQIYEKQSAS